MSRTEAYSGYPLPALSVPHDWVLRKLSWVTRLKVMLSGDGHVELAAVKQNAISVAFKTVESHMTDILML